MGLSRPETYAGYISWDDSPRLCIRIPDPEAFVVQVCTPNGLSTKLSALRRNFQLHGFHKIRCRTSEWKMFHSSGLLARAPSSSAIAPSSLAAIATFRTRKARPRASAPSSSSPPASGSAHCQGGCSHARAAQSRISELEARVRELEDMLSQSQSQSQSPAHAPRFPLPLPLQVHPIAGDEHAAGSPFSLSASCTPHPHPHASLSGGSGPSARGKRSRSPSLCIDDVGIDVGVDVGTLHGFDMTVFDLGAQSQGMDEQELITSMFQGLLPPLEPVSFAHAEECGGLDLSALTSPPILRPAKRHRSLH